MSRLDDATTDLLVDFDNRAIGPAVPQQVKHRASHFRRRRRVGRFTCSLALCGLLLASVSVVLRDPATTVDLGPNVAPPGSGLASIGPPIRTRLDERFELEASLTGTGITAAAAGALVRERLSFLPSGSFSITTTAETVRVVTTGVDFELLDWALFRSGEATLEIGYSIVPGVVCGRDLGPTEFESLPPFPGVKAAWQVECVARDPDARRSLPDPLRRVEVVPTGPGANGPGFGVVITLSDCTAELCRGALLRFDESLLRVTEVDNQFVVRLPNGVLPEPRAPGSPYNTRSWSPGGSFGLTEIRAQAIASALRIPMPLPFFNVTPQPLGTTVPVGAAPPSAPTPRTAAATWVFRGQGVALAEFARARGVAHGRLGVLLGPSGFDESQTGDEFRVWIFDEAMVDLVDRILTHRGDVALEGPFPHTDDPKTCTGLGSSTVDPDIVRVDESHPLAVPRWNGSCSVRTGDGSARSSVALNPLGSNGASLLEVSVAPQS